MDVAVTVDELLLWDGTPMPSGYTAHTVMDGLLRALSDHSVAGAYGFAHSSPIEDSPAAQEVLERWIAAGHHLGNHTHCHASLNWLSGERYVEDIRKAEDFIGEYIERAPTKYFRYTMDMSGDEEAKRGFVEDFLRSEAYVAAPVTAWFGDFAWIAPYARALDAGDRETAKWLRQSYVDAAVRQLHASAETARRLVGVEVPHIWLIHGTPIAQDTLSDILQRFGDEGVHFIGLDEAMKNPINRAMSPITPLFRNHLQRLAAAVGDAVPETPTEVMGQVLTAALPEGEHPLEVYEAILARMASRAGTTSERWSWD
jgi:peptidoglycan/xylan/chitin deacetylase (PgdA/CDA1 family)